MLGVSETHIRDNELEVRTNNTQTECGERKSPIRIAVSLHCSEYESGEVCTCTNAYEQFVGDFVLDQGSYDVRCYSTDDHRQHV